MEICEDRTIPTSPEDTIVVVDTNVLISNLRLVKIMVDLTLSGNIEYDLLTSCILIFIFKVLWT